MEKTICVFCSSRDSIEEVYFKAARELGMAMAKLNYRLVFGGGRVGLMGALAKTIKEQGGKIVGVIPEKLNRIGIKFENIELIVTKDMRERKAIMEKQADAFMALPGGFGTLEESLEIITLKQLDYHNKPFIFLNINGFFNPLINLFEHIFSENFAKPASRNLYHVTDNVNDALAYLESYRPQRILNKWG